MWDKGLPNLLDRRVIQTFDKLFFKRQCKFCEQSIWIVLTKTGKRVPISQRGVTHFADCPNYERQ